MEYRETYKALGVEAIVRALRCTSSVGSKCTQQCPFWRQEEVPEELRAVMDGAESWDDCDVDGVSLAAADRLEELAAAWEAQQGYDPKLRPPPERFLARTRWGKLLLVERRNFDDPDWLVGGMYIPKDITWWWPLPEGGAE